MKKKSITINAMINVIRSCMSIIFPLITYPYATRVLGVENLGKVNYSASIESYFALLAVLGMTTYAIREGARVRDNSVKFQAFANQIYTVNIITTIVAYILMFLLIFYSPNLKDYSTLILLQSISILFTTIGIEWINTVYEDFLYIALRTIGVYFINMILLFVLVKSSDDYYIYAGITVFVNAVIAITNRLYCRKYVKLKVVFNNKFLYHIKNMVVFFANNLAITIYVSADSTMLGWMIGDYYVGLYAIATKVYGIIKSMLAAVYAVVIPRLSSKSLREDDEFDSLFMKLICSLTVIVFPAMTFLAVLSKPIILILSGEDYSHAIGALQILSVALVFAIYGGAIANCYNIPKGKEKVNLSATTLSALLNIGVNLYFIPHFYHYGAAFTTLLSELFIVLFCSIRNREMFKKFFCNKLFIRNVLQTLLGISVIVIAGAVVTRLVVNIWLELLLVAVIGGIGYLTTLVLLKNIYVIELFNIIKSKIQSK